MLSGDCCGEITVDAPLDRAGDIVVMSATDALYRKGSGEIGLTAGEDGSGAFNARSGLMGLHSSSKVTERLEMTVLVSG